MPRRLLLALLVLVAAPLVLLGWVSAAAMADSEERAKQQLTALLQSRLVEIDRVASKLFDDYALKITNSVSTQNVIRQLEGLRRDTPIVRQGIFVSANGQLLHPRRPESDDPDALALYASLPGMISGRSDLSAANNPQAFNTQPSFPNAPNQPAFTNNLPMTKSVQRTNDFAKGKVPAQKTEPQRLPGTLAPNSESSANDWQVWYMDQGMQLILWLPRSDGSSVGVLLERPRWTSDLIASLPESKPQASETSETSIPGFTVLLDEANQIVYRWGDEGKLSAKPAASISMSAPLGAWKWQFHTDAPLIPAVSSLPLIASLVGIGVVLLALGSYVLTSVQRQVRSAKNRVSFAGQVSHELRTPLTNIRLYAELAESDLESIPASEHRDSLAKRLGVIDSESKRLSRLVSGVLEMIRDGKQQRGPRFARANPNALIQETLGQFKPGFERLGFEIETQLDSDKEVAMDADIFEMVLVNLLSNVEKYAAEGKFVRIESELTVEDEAGYLTVSVMDHGPGVSKRYRESIFRPFTRLDNSISAPSGTGIGLTIARGAAARHGGTLKLESSERGAKFRFQIPVQDALNEVSAGPAKDFTKA